MLSENQIRSLAVVAEQRTGLPFTHERMKRLIEESTWQHKQDFLQEIASYYPEDFDYLDTAERELLTTLISKTLIGPEAVPPINADTEEYRQDFVSQLVAGWDAMFPEQPEAEGPFV